MANIPKWREISAIIRRRETDANNSKIRKCTIIIIRDFN
jgi:hypothetical protein